MEDEPLAMCTSPEQPHRETGDPPGIATNDNPYHTEYSNPIIPILLAFI
jgi:hypothetical protein